MPRKVSAQHREALLDAALECFSKRGFDATRVEDIARLAGVAKGSVYTHFKDKEALFQGLIESTLLPLYRQVQEIQRDKTLTLREKITRAAQPLLDDNGNSKFARVMRLFGRRVCTIPRLSIRSTVNLLTGFWHSVLRRSLIRLTETYPKRCANILNFFLLGLCRASCGKVFLPIPALWTCRHTGKRTLICSWAKTSRERNVGQAGVHEKTVRHAAR